MRIIPKMCFSDLNAIHLHRGTRRWPRELREYDLLKSSFGRAGARINMDPYSSRRADYVLIVRVRPVKVDKAFRT